LAILASRCRWTGTNTSYTKFELEHIFRTAQVKYVITRVEQLDTVEAAVQASGTNAEIIIFSDILHESSVSTLSASSGDVAVDAAPRIDSTRSTPEAAARRTLHDLLRPDGKVSLGVALNSIDPHSIATLSSTSGTTGRPKMAARSHAALIHEALGIEDNNADKPYPIRRLINTPIFHGFSCPEMTINSLRLGFPVYFLPRFDRVRFPQLVATYGITETFAPPPMLLALLNDPQSHSLLQSLRAVYTGGAPLSASLAASFRAICPVSATRAPLRIVQVWGMTEGGWYTTQKYPHDADSDVSGSVGQALPGVEVRVDPTVAGTAVDLTFSTGETDQTTGGPKSEVGELLIRSPQMMSMYFGDPVATARAFTADGFLRTGDIGYLQQASPAPRRTRPGHRRRSSLKHVVYRARTSTILGAFRGKQIPDSVVLVDRAKDLIKVNGFQVAPAELEDALLLHPAVMDVGVVGFCPSASNLPERTAPSMSSSKQLHTTPLPSSLSSTSSSSSFLPLSSIALDQATASVSEHPVAFVVLHRSSSSPPPTIDELRGWLAQRLTRYKVSRCDFRFVDSIPKSAAGKILRNDLRHVLEQEQ
jgi:acyl-CoA synthetase (AMP-forming)/AMP-acid ligase II